MMYNRGNIISVGAADRPGEEEKRETRTEVTVSLTGSGVTLCLVAQEETSSGTLALSFDKEALKLADCKVEGDVTLVTETDTGLTLAYAADHETAVAAGETIATVELAWAAEAPARLTVTLEDFNNREGLHLVLAVLNLDPSLPFTDVAKNQWFYDAVKYTYDRGWFTGMTETRFQPQGKLTRAMFVTLLGRMAGVEAEARWETSFVDVKQGAYYDADNGMDVAAYQEDWAMGRGGVFGLTLACDDEGSLYVLGNVTDEETSGAQLWKAQLQEQWGSVSFGPFRMVGETGISMDYLQSMTWDHNTETLYWAHFNASGIGRIESTLERIDPATGACTRVGTLSGETCCLFAPLGDAAAALETHANVPEMSPDEVGTPVLRDDAITMNVGSVQTLLYDLDPWYTAHKDVVWSSDNEAVATVDQDGNVTAVSEGSCIITAAARDDETKFDTCKVEVASLSLSFDGIISAQTAGLGNVSGVCTYNYAMEEGAPSYGTKVALSWPEEFQGYGTSLASSALGRGSLWVCEYGNAGMIYEIDPETGVVKDMLQPIDGDMMFGISYSDVTDRFNCIMNFYLYVDQPFTREAYKDMEESYNEETYQFEYHRLNMLKYLAASDKNFRTGENGNGSMSDIVFCGITTLPGGQSQSLSKDYLGQWGGSAYYTPTLTLALLDNVGRFWYIDEITDMVKYTDDYGNVFFTDEAMEMAIDPAFNGVEAVGYDTDGDGEDDTYSVFVIRALQETPLTDMYLAGTMPRITYHFSDIEYAGSLEDGTPMIALSLYDYWNNGLTNELYLYVPGHETNEWDYETWTKIRTPDRLFDLGDTGIHNIIATIHSATVTGGVAVQEAALTHTLARGYYTE